MTPLSPDASSAATGGWLEWRRLELAPDLALVGPAVRRMMDDLAAHAVRADERDAWQLAAMEALTNAMSHGAPRAGAGDIWLEWRVEPPAVTVRVSEPGRFEPGPDWAELPEDELDEGGRGGFLIAQSVDTWRHENRDGRHVLVMEKQTRASGSPARAMRELEQALEGMAEETSAAYETVATLTRLAENLAEANGFPMFVQKALAQTGAVLPASAVVIRVVEEGGLRRLHGPGPEWLPFEAPAVECTAFAAGREATVEARASLGPSDPLRAAAGCAFVCPIRFQERLTGVLSVLRETTEFFSAGQLGVWRSVADFVGVAQVNAELQAQRQEQIRTRLELDVAKRIQASLLPARMPQRADWRVHGVCANAHEVGGDFFDIVELPAGGYLVLIADVMGKGLPAALLASVLRATMRARIHLAETPGRLLTEVNTQLTRDLDRLGMFITAQAVYLPPGDGDPAGASAGHPPLLGLPAAGGWVELLAGAGLGLPLGVDAAVAYETERFTCAPGDRLVLMTDGITEVEDAAGAPLGQEGAARALTGRWAAGPVDACIRLLAAAESHGGASASAADDRTVLAVERGRIG